MSTVEYPPNMGHGTERGVGNQMSWMNVGTVGLMVSLNQFQSKLILSRLCGWLTS